MLNGCRDHCQCSPQENHAREEDTWFDVVKGQVGWDLSDDIANCEDGIDLIELVSMEVQVFLHTGNVGIVQI